MMENDRDDRRSDPRKDAWTPDEIEAATTRAVTHIESRAKDIAADTRSEIQVKTRHWLTASAGALFLAVGLLTFFGYREVAHFDDRLQALEKKAADKIAEVQETIDEAAARATRRLHSARKELSAVEAELAKRRQELAAARETLAKTEQALSNAQRVREQYARAEADLSGDLAWLSRHLEQIALAQHATYDIFVIYHGEDDELDSVLSSLRARLAPHGFKVPPGNVFTSTVERNEVIYADRSYPTQLHTLVSLVRAELDPARVTKRFVGERHPREVLIKIRDF